MADVLGQPIRFPKVKEASALGAVILGWQSQGRINSLAEASTYIELTQQIAVQKKPIVCITKYILCLSPHSKN